MDRSNKPIYLDYHSTTPCDPRVVEAMLPYFSQEFGNPSSKDHDFGILASSAVEKARSKIAELLGATSQEIVFTSSTTESNHLAIWGIARAYEGKGKHIISAKTEHASVLAPLVELEKRGYEVTWLSVDREGNVDLKELASKIRKDTILITLMHGNNEIGTVHPIEHIARIAKQEGVPFHSDAAQSVGREPIDVAKIEVDMLSLSSHKIYGPKGIAALYVRSKKPRIKLAPWLMGGGQENGMRASTLNVPGIVGMGKAYELINQEFEAMSTLTAGLRNRFERKIQAELEAIKVLGNSRHRLIHNLSVLVPKIGHAKDFIKRLSPLALSTGSSCSSTSLEPSHVLLGIGLASEEALSCVRFGFGKYLTIQEVDLAAEMFIRAVKKNRSEGKYV